MRRFLTCSRSPFLLQQVELGVDDDLHQVVAGSGFLPATRRWFDFLWSRIFSLKKNYWPGFLSGQHHGIVRRRRGERVIGTNMY